MSNPQTFRTRALPRNWVVPALIAGLLAALLVHPAVPRFLRGQLPDSIDLRGFGYFAHMASYATLTTLLLMMFRQSRSSTRTLLVLGIALHGLLTEAAQYWIPARDCDPLDLLANLTGIALAAGGYAVVFSRFFLQSHPEFAPRMARTGKDC